MIGAVGRMVLVMAVLLLVLTYLLLRGATPDIDLQERRLDALDALVLNQAALHRDVLMARAGMLRNYDPLVLDVDGLRRAAKELQAAGRMGERLERRLENLMAEVSKQEALVNDFKSNNALLQNSLTYFSHVSHRLGMFAKDNPTAAATVGTLANAMLRFMIDPSEDAAAAVAASLHRLDELPLTRLQDDADALAVHGRLILATVPLMDNILARLFAARATEQARAIQTLFIDEFRRAETRAWTFRILLYVASVLLLAYLGYLYLRLRANAQALAERSQALQGRSDFEHLIAGISARFIDLPHERIGAGICQGLEQLSQYAGVDRAYVVLFDADRIKAKAAYSWCREGIDTPDRWPDGALSVLSGWSLEGHAHQGCIVISSVPALPQSGEKSALSAYGIRSWLCIPLWHAGDRIGLLGFDTVESEKRWADGDIALLRTAGEIFANALERERAEQERQALESRLRHAQRMKAIGTLAGGIAHDFNNSLGAILGYAEMALSRLRRDSREWHHVQEVRRAGERARDVVDQILAFSRRTEQRHRPVRMRALFQEAMGLLRASLSATVAVRMAVPDEDPVVLGEPGRLQQVILNLCTNAAQAMAAQGTIDVALDIVEIATERVLSHGTLAAGRYVRLAVTDTGEGMDAATMERIFEPFFTTKAAGTGLGLAMVHGIVADHGGAIHVRSRTGVGSSFEAYFRQVKDASVEDDRWDAPPPLGQGETILIVDDEKPLVLLGEEMVAALGYEPVGFDSSSRALAAFRANPQRFDLVLADEVMPEMTGTQLAAALRAIRPALPIILMTGYSGAVDASRVRAAGIREILRKPLLSADIANALARHLRKDGRSAAASPARPA